MVTAENVSSSSATPLFGEALAFALDRLRVLLALLTALRFNAAEAADASRNGHVSTAQVELFGPPCSDTERGEEEWHTMSHCLAHPARTHRGAGQGGMAIGCVGLARPQPYCPSVARWA